MTQIPATNPLYTVVRPNVGSRFSDMSTEDFIRIIFAELANQDPLAPSDSTALLQQPNSIRSIESDLQLIDQLKALVTENQLAAGSNLIGKFVTGLTASSDRVSGQVRSVSREGDSGVLTLDNGFSVTFDSLDTIHDTDPDL